MTPGVLNQAQVQRVLFSILLPRRRRLRCKSSDRSIPQSSRTLPLLSLQCTASHLPGNLSSLFSWHIVNELSRPWRRVPVRPLPKYLMDVGAWPSSVSHYAATGLVGGIDGTGTRASITRRKLSSWVRELSMRGERHG
jgi:hypothetical protein